MWQSAMTVTTIRTAPAHPAGGFIQLSLFASAAEGADESTSIDNRKPGPEPKYSVKEGQRFGYGVILNSLIEIRFPSSRYPIRGARLLCDCGIEYDTPLYALFRKRGKTISCGCQKRKTRLDLVGERFGLLTVIKAAERGQRGRTQWLCECDCGNRKVIEAHQMRQGAVRSCGCLRNPPKPGSAKRSVLRAYKGAAAKRKLDWELSDQQFNDLTSDWCHYCGVPPSRTSCAKSGEQYVWNGIDRVDNTLGYIPGNVVSCCSICNIAKRDLSLAEFLAWVIRVAAYQAERNGVLA